MYEKYVKSGCRWLSPCEWLKRYFEIQFEWLEHPDWDASVEIWLESHFRPPPNVVWIRSTKTGLQVFFFAVQTFENQSRYNLDMPKIGFWLAVWIRPWSLPVWLTSYPLHKEHHPCYRIVSPLLGHGKKLVALLHCITLAQDFFSNMVLKLSRAFCSLLSNTLLLTDNRNARFGCYMLHYLSCEDP